MKSREFHIGDLLSVTTGEVVSPRGREGLHDILGFISGQGEYISEEEIRIVNLGCNTLLLEQHPFLWEILPPGQLDAEGIKKWLDTQIATHGELHKVQSLCTCDE